MFDCPSFSKWRDSVSASFTITQLAATNNSANWATLPVSDQREVRQFY
jgi:hypothetical protein